MNDYSRREIATIRIEFAMPSGTFIGEIGKLEAVAWQDFCRLNGNAPGGFRPDDWCRYESRDDEIVLVFQVDKKVDPS